MRKTGTKPKGVGKGMPSAVLLSILIHAGLFLLAGMLVVFTVVKKEEQKFEPPKAVERPKMKLKKPKVKIRKSSRPKSTARIVTRNNRASMPDIQLPEMSGMGDGLGEDFGDAFELMPDLDKVSVFGGGRSIGNDLSGNFYNFNRNRMGRKIPMNPDQFGLLLHKYLKSGWKSSVIASYYRSLNTLYTPTICVPTVMSELAPKAFGEDGAEGYCWATIYKGQLVYPEDITFRFWGVGDKFMSVRVAGETVLICAFRNRVRSQFSDIWQSNDSKNFVYSFAESRAQPSDWITLKAGEPQEIQVLMADFEGGLVYHILSVEVEGETYPLERANGGATFPIFRTQELSRDTLDILYNDLYEGDTCLTNGPIFRDYNSQPVKNEAAFAVGTVSATDKEEGSDSTLRVWTRAGGKTLEAEFVTVIGGKAVLKTVSGEQVKLVLDELSEPDREYIELATPPEFDINFVKKSKQIPNPPVSPFLSGGQRPLQIFNYNFGVKIKQQSAGEYKRRLTIEYFAVGEEVDGDKYVLLDRKVSTFTPTRENRKSHEFRGEEVEVMRIARRSSSPMRGTKYSGYLVVISDERGKIIQYETSNKFLFENFENLKHLSPNNYFDRDCNRVFPTRPSEDSRGDYGKTRTAG